jgi:nuclease HARBI1
MRYAKKVRRLSIALGLLMARSAPSAVLQKQSFNGHKRVHSLNLQSVSAPDGIILDLTGPWKGKRHDCGMLRRSGLLERLEKNQSEFWHGLYIRRSRISSELCSTNFFQGIAHLVSTDLFPFVDFKQNLKVYLQPVAKFCKIAVLFTNVHTCLYGSVTTSFHEMEAPELKCYLIRAEGSS